MRTMLEFVPRAEELVNVLIDEVNGSTTDLHLAEERILTFVYEIGHEMLHQV